MSMNKQTRATFCPFFLVVFDHRDSFNRMLNGCGVNSSSTRANELKQVIWGGVRAALPRVQSHAQPAILINRAHLHIAAKAQGAGVRVALALEQSGTDSLCAEAPLTDLERDLKTLRRGHGKVLIRWDTDDLVSHRRRQLATLSALRDVVDGAGAELLVELLVKSTSRPVPGSASSRAWEESMLPRLQYDAVAEILDAGVAPATWKIEGHSNNGAPSRMAALVGSARPDASLLVLGGDRSIAELSQVFSCRAGSKRFSGFAVGRSIWRDPVVALCRNEITASLARRIVRDNFLAAVDVFDSVSGGPERTC